MRVEGQVMGSKTAAKVVEFNINVKRISLVTENSSKELDYIKVK